MQPAQASPPLHYFRGDRSAASPAVAPAVKSPEPSRWLERALQASTPVAVRTRSQPTGTRSRPAMGRSIRVEPWRSPQCEGPGRTGSPRLGFSLRLSPVACNRVLMPAAHYMLAIIFLRAWLRRMTVLRSRNADRVENCAVAPAISGRRETAWQLLASAWRSSADVDHRVVKSSGVRRPDSAPKGTACRGDCHEPR